MNLLALNLADAVVMVALIGATAYVLTWVGMAIIGRTPGHGAPHYAGIDDDLAAIRADLADLKESIAELDRQFKSVG